MWFWSLRPVKNRFFIDKNRFLAIQVSIRIDTAYQVLSPSLMNTKGLLHTAMKTFKKSTFTFHKASF